MIDSPLVINAYWHFIILQLFLLFHVVQNSRDQRLLAFHYFAGQLLKRLLGKAPQPNFTSISADLTTNRQKLTKFVTIGKIIEAESVVMNTF